jgi:uncharacterized protein
VDLLRDQFREIWIPAAAASELEHIPDPAARESVRSALQIGWIKPREVSESPLLDLLSADLHAGEVEAIALALEVKADHLLIDEKEGRATARRLGLALTGVLGVLLRAKKNGKIAALKPEIDALRDKARFFIAPALEAQVLKEANE